MRTMRRRRSVATPEVATSHNTAPQSASSHHDQQEQEQPSLPASDDQPAVGFAFQVAMFVSDLDPFAVYKEAQARKDYARRHGGVALRALKVSALDGHRARFAAANRLFMSYLTLKGLVAGALQFLMLRHEVCLARNATTIAGDNHRWPPPPAGKVDWLRRASTLLGNPLAPAGGTAIYLYVGMTGLGFLRALVLPLYYRRRGCALDMAYLRFLLSPCLEQGRLDELVRCKVRAIECSIWNLASNRVCAAERAQHEALLLHRFTNCHHTPTTTTGKYLALASALAIARDMRDKCAIRVARGVRALASAPAQVAELRPRVFQLEWRGRLSGPFGRFSACLMGSTALMTVLMVSAFAYVGVRAHLLCNKQGAQQAGAHGRPRRQAFDLVLSDDKCHPFDWPDGLFACELMFAILCCACYEVNHMNLCGVNLADQIGLIVSMRRELELCEMALADDERGPSESDPGNQELAPSDRLLLRQVAKLAVFESELADGFRAIAHLMLMFAYHFAGLASIMFATDGMQTELSLQIRNATLLLMFVWLNSSALLCCSIHARLTELERRLWSLLGRMTAIRVGRGSAAEPLDLIRELWQKFVLAVSGNMEHYCVRLFGVQLTYKRVLELNFMGIFIYSLSLANKTTTRG